MSTPVRASAPRPAAARRVDASMDLLNDILRNPIDPDYRARAGRSAADPHRVRLGLVAVGVGLLFALAGMQATRQRPAMVDERARLVAQIHGAERRNDALRAEVADNRTQVADLRTRPTEGDEDRQLQADLRAAAAATGAEGVQGPGLVVVVDDAPGDSPDNRVLDRDLQQLANGLWASGAEAVAVNGHRLSSLTAIRGAGDSITVDYRSLVRPYRVEAIGAPRTLRTRFEASAGGRTWAVLRDRYGLQYSVEESRELRLAGDPGLAVKHARRPA